MKSFVERACESIETVKTWNQASTSRLDRNAFPLAESPRLDISPARWEVDVKW